MPTAESAATGTESSRTSRRALPLWAALALSVATVGPTLAMAGNGQGLVGTVGKSIPLVFVIGLVGISLVGYSFVRLTRYFSHAGSAYALVGATVGPRAGFFAGFAMLGAYLGFSIATLALTAAFTNSLLAEAQKGSPHPFQVPWLVPVAVAAVFSVMLTGRDARLLAKILLGIEGVGIVAMVVLAAVGAQALTGPLQWGLSGPQPQPGANHTDTMGGTAQGPPPTTCMPPRDRPGTARPVCLIQVGPGRTTSG